MIILAQFYKNKFTNFFIFSLQKMISENSEVMSIINNFKRLTKTVEFKYKKTLDHMKKW